MAKTISVWVAVNKNGNVVMFAELPTRDEERGIWVSKYPFVNSLLYKDFKELFEKQKYSWENEPECFQLDFNKL